jgi:uncharacterized protein (DUF362 family)
LAFAGQREKFESTIAAGLKCLDGWRQRDGSYRLDRGREEAVWGTALALLVLEALDASQQAQQQTASFLLGVRGKPGQEDADTDAYFDIDVKLVGWPWAEGTFSWVEPTAWACLALQKCGQQRHPRVEEGVRLLLDRAFDTGGANYGNKLVLGRTTEPIPGPSAILLLALQHHGGEPRIRAALDYVKRNAETTWDVEHLALAKLALSVHGVGSPIDERIREGLRRARSEGWAVRSVPRLVLAGLALQNQQANPLRLVDGAAPFALESKPPVPRSTPLAERIRTGIKALVARGLDRLRQPPPRSVVHIARANSYDDDLPAVVKRQYEHFRELVPLAGKRVVLKPNLVEYHRDKVINTHPRVIEAMIELCRGEGAADVIVAEGPGHWRNVEYLVAESGLGEVLNRHQVKFVDLNHDEPVKLLNLGRLTGLPHLFIARTVATAEVLISMPKLKTHHWAGATLSLKNLFGTLPGICYGWPKNELHWRGIAESIIDIALTCTPHLALIDGVIGMEGDGPLNGVARPVGALVMGNDLVATDATGCRLMGLPTERIAHVVLGARKRLGRMRVDDIQQVGETIESLAQTFERPPRFNQIALPEPAAAMK